MWSGRKRSEGGWTRTRRSGISKRPRRGPVMDHHPGPPPRGARAATQTSTSATARRRSEPCHGRARRARRGCDRKEPDALHRYWSDSSDHRRRPAPQGALERSTPCSAGRLRRPAGSGPSAQAAPARPSPAAWGTRTPRAFELSGVELPHVPELEHEALDAMPGLEAAARTLAAAGIDAHVEQDGVR